MSMSKQFDSDLPDGDMPEIAFGYDDLESDLEEALWDIETDEDGLEVEYEDEDTVDEYGDDGIPF